MPAGLQKLRIKVLPQGPEFDVAFNPEEYTVSKDNNYAVQGIPGLSAPLVQFVNGNLRTLEMELFFDTWDTPDLPKQDVRELTGQVVGLLDIDPELHAPPILSVSWSSLQLQCVLAKVSQKFLMFADDGTPVRARLNVTFDEIVDPEQEAKAVGRQTADFSKSYQVVAGDTLAGIAARLYADPTRWRPIAVANDLSDPRALVPGQMLRIPSLPYVDPETLEAVS
jgi:LysM repeat protein